MFNHRTLLGVMLTLVVGLSAARTPAEQVTLVRDTWGIAHVVASTDEGAMFGAGYATAADRLYQMHRNRRAVQGRLAELVGQVNGPNGTTVDQDENMRHRGFYAHALRLIPQLDCATVRLLQAYSDGVNQYIAEHSGSLLYLFDGQVPEPWTPADCVASWDRMGDYFAGFPSNEAATLHQFEDLVDKSGSVEAAIDAMTTDPIIDDSAAVVLMSDLDPATIQRMFDYADAHATCGARGGLPDARSPIEYPKFSHAWVVGGAKTTTGAAILHSDPQTKIAAPAIWYEIHVKGATFDVRGIGVAGCPGFLIAYNAHVAWGLTALGADMEDLFRLRMVGPNQYEYDGVTYNMEVSQQQIIIKDRGPQNITVKNTILGPVVTPLVSDVHPGEEYILKAVPQADPDRHTVQGLFAMMRSTDANSLAAALDGWRGPAANCVFGDSAGNIGYWALAAIPLRSPCSPLGGAMAQDGGSSQFDWVETIPLGIRPHVINPAAGVLFSGNHLPIGSWYPVPLGLGTGGSGDTERSWRLRERLIENAPALFSPADVLSVHNDDVHPARREIVRAGLHARDVLGLTLSSAANNALNVLQGWYNAGAHSTTRHANYAAAHHMNLQFRQNTAPNLVPIYGGGNNGLAFFLKTLKARLDNDPNAPIDGDELAYINLSLSAGWNTAVALYGSNVSAWQAAFAAGPGTLQVQYFNTLEGFGPLDPTHNQSWPGISDPDGGTILSQLAESYSQSVNLANVDSSVAILPTGTSEDPASPYFDDQAPLLVNGTLRPAPLSQAAIGGIATSTSAVTFEPALPGDFDGDGDVDAVDFGNFVYCFSGPGLTPEGQDPIGRGECQCIFDFDGDTDIDLVDFSAFENVFSTP